MRVWRLGRCANLSLVVAAERVICEAGERSVMNGVHDMGEMQGFGPVAEEKNESVFHAEWEGRVVALNFALVAWGKWNLNVARAATESLPPADYLSLSYYQNGAHV